MALRRWNIGLRRIPVHEATRRAWCRLLFVLCGVLPVLLTFLACCAESLPAYQRSRVSRYSQLLSQTTGLCVQVQRVKLLTPTSRWLFGIQLNHPETGEPLGKIDGLWISETPSGCAIHAQQAVLSAEQLATSYRLLHEQLLCRPPATTEASALRLSSSPGHAVVLWMNDLVIHGESEPSLTFSKLKIELKRQPLATAAAIRYRLSSFPGQEAILTFDRHHDQIEPVSHWTLSSGEQALPGVWVNRFINNYSIAGTDSAFTGDFDLKVNETFWNLSGSGRMLRVDSNSWFERPLLSGVAYLDVTGFNLTDRGLNSASGSLLIQDGRIHADLLTAAQHIAIETVGGYEQFEKLPGRAVPFQAITADFKLDSEGLRIEPRRTDGAVVYDAVGPIAKKLSQWSLVPTNNVAVCICNTASSEAQRSSTFSRAIQWLPRPNSTTANYQASQ